MSGLLSRFASKDGCPCTNNTSTLASLSDRQCQLSSGDTGIQLTLGGPCVPFSYGSSQCLQHDLLYDPYCQVDRAGETIIPPYCFRPFCYVDVATCKKISNERAFRSVYFSFESDVNLFYSYSTCSNSTADDWSTVEYDNMGSEMLGGISITGNIPTYMLPMMYKRGINGEVLTTVGSEYYDDSIPYEGVYLSYVKKIVEISNGDIININVTHRSKASSLVHPTSSYTAAVQDLNDGLVDMAIGPFWITGQRLKLSSFTLPIVYDKTYLVIPTPGKQDTLNDQVSKVLAPFSIGLWGLVLGIIAFAALLSVWFSDRPASATARDLQNNRMIGLQRGGTKKRRRKRAYARLALDSFLEKGLWFCSAGVEQDESSSLPNKLLLFGFGFFILISVSAYVANLAAFLTLSGTSDDVKTMGGAVAKGMTICAHPALKAELQVSWPDANFYFHEAGLEFNGMLEDWDAGKCRVMAVGYEDTSMDTTYLKALCERGLVFTDSLVAEIPIAFPIRPGLSAGFSYWMYQGNRYHGASLQTEKGEFSQDIGCNVHFSGEATGGSEHDQISVKNMFFPIMFFVGCAVIAVLCQLIHLYEVKKGKESLVGRRSTLDLVTEIDTSRQRRQLLGKKQWWEKRRMSYKSDLSSKEDEEDETHNVTGFNNDDNYDDEQIIGSARSIMKGDLPISDEVHNMDMFEDNGKTCSVTFAD